MATRGRYVKPRRGLDESPKTFDLSHVFPEVEGVERGPLPKQRLVYETIRSGKCEGGGFVYQGGKGCAKLLDVSTPVLTTNGWKTMGTIVAGDRVFSDDGSPCLVRAISRIRRGRQCWRVGFSDGTSIVTSGDHGWLTFTHAERKRKRRGQVRTTDEIRATLKRCGGRFNNHSIDNAAPLQTPSAILPIHPYVLGYWLGDGHSAHASLSVGKSDVAAVSALMGARAVSVGVREYLLRAPVVSLGSQPPRRNAAGRFESAGSMTAKLRALGVLNNKHIPEPYFWADEHQRRELLAGLLDSDGTVAEGHGRVAFTNCNEGIALGVVRLARSLGMAPTVTRSRSTLYGSDKGPSFQVRMRPHFPPFRLDRKMAKWRRPGAQARRTRQRMITSVEPVPSVPVRCIETDSKSHLFLAGEALVPTHNTICGVGALFMVHHRPEWRGLTSVVARESYPALMTGTWDEVKKALDRTPVKLLKSVREPSTNSMGFIEWAYGGTTMFLSLSDERTWASGNFGFAWVDEGHLQDGNIVGKLSERLRQDQSPRTMLITSNPAGRCYFWGWAHEKSEHRLPNWHMVESSMFENPYLPKDYIARMEARYPPGTPGHRRWVLGQSAALEGTAFENFYPDPDDKIHVIPPITIPEEWRRGRGLDWGIDNPCCVVWAAKTPEGEFYAYRTHMQNARSVEWHANQILMQEEGEDIVDTPSDPEIFRGVHWKDGSAAESTADQFRRFGVRVTQANNDRKLRVERFLDLISVDNTRVHPVTLKMGAPRLYILDTPDNQPLINCLATIKWRPKPATGLSDSPDDVEKKDDHPYDALGYLVVELPDRVEREGIPGRAAAMSRMRGGGGRR